MHYRRHWMFSLQDGVPVLEGTWDEGRTLIRNDNLLASGGYPTRNEVRQLPDLPAVPRPVDRPWIEFCQLSSGSVHVLYASGWEFPPDYRGENTEDGEILTDLLRQVS